MTLAPVTIDDKFTVPHGQVLLSGTQALVRAALMQRARDRAAGLDTAGYISGYRGSPLGGLDLQLARATALLGESQIHFEPGLNEDLAATAVLGTQVANAVGNARHDGVFGMWYGKGPGVDRSGDALKHCNHFGTSRHGGVLAVFGDDHPGKSSTVAHQSEQAMVSFSMPVLYPATIQEFLDFALMGWGLSRYSGLWIGFKCVNETVENTATACVDGERIQLHLPALHDADPDGHIQMRYAPQEDDVIVQRVRLPRVAAFAAANPFDRRMLGTPGARLGIVTSGKAYLDVMEALRSLDVDPARARALGISVYKIGLVWPLHEDGFRAFARGTEELLFIEEKRAFLEPQGASALYNLSERPRITGKRSPDGAPLLPADVQLDTTTVARAIVARLEALGGADPALLARAHALGAAGDAAAAVEGAALVRTPFYCSGCPHNRSTKIPDGSLASAGIGCHGMAALFVPNTLAPTQMGAEGATWIGMARFTHTPHMFQNLGDGTYSHSGVLAIRAAVNAGVNITYKVLFNDAVAMTGGQPIEGQLSVDAIARQISAEGVRHIAMVTDEPEKYHRGVRFPPGAAIHHRKHLGRIQREMRDTAGVTVIIYDQTCAAEKRRRRKRGAFPNPARRPFINERVCEGCGDCSVQANCVSIQPKDTPEGRKRFIDQSSCNKDLSCIEGFCPSFVTVHGVEPRKPVAQAGPRRDFAASLPVPPPAALDAPVSILINGVGGTGVVTIGAVLGMAAHMEGKSVSIFDMTGLSQKGGTVFSHLRLAPAEQPIHGARIGPAGADLILGCDLVVSAGKESLAAIKPGLTQAVVNSHLVPTGAFQRNPDLTLDAASLQDTVRNTLGASHYHPVDASGLASTLLGDSIGANMFVVGFALQRGLLPLSAEAVETAVRLNAVAVDLNLDALALGRLAATDPGACAALLDAAATPAGTAVDGSLDGFIEGRVAALVSYQDAAYAERYRALVNRARRVEADVVPGSEALTWAVARYLYKVMAYKDEYEVARLYTDGTFEAALAEQFEPGYTLSFHLAPPWFASRDPSTGLPAKREFGAWILGAMRLLAGLKGLRGGALDLFGMSAERRAERRVRDEYMATIERLTQTLTPASHAVAIELAEVPERIRGFGHVKQAHLERARAHREALLERLAAVDDTATYGAPAAAANVS